MTTRITQQQLETYLWGAAVLLRGTIDAGDYKQFIFPLLFYKRLCDVFDEEMQTALAESDGDLAYASGREQHRFQIPPEAHWQEVRRAANNVGQVLQNGMRAIETANPDKLYGIFGDAQWTNKERLPDAMLRDLVEHFSGLSLTVANLPEDELGQGYEYLIKKFADDSGHTAAEFYTNRTVVHLMTEMLQPQPGESVYDPTCGSGGMLLSCITHVRRQGKEWRNVRLYGQERNLMTSSIARMNCFLHGIEDFRIERGDTLSDPKFVQGDRLMRFDVVLANPPYSIKQWDREAFASDPWGRNRYGTPPQGRADYAFWQHILASLTANTGRCAILFPHGVLFRQEEAEMRRTLLDADLIECIIGLGPNLFYNSPMEACVVVCRSNKPKARRGNVLFINAVTEVTRERAQSFLTDDHISRIICAYKQFADDPGFARVVSLEEIRIKDGNLSIPLFVGSANGAAGADKVEAGDLHPLPETLDRWLVSRRATAASLRSLLPDFAPAEFDETLNGMGALPLFDRSAWRRVKLGDVVETVNDTCDPIAAGIDRFIGLEHLEPRSLHVDDWGDVATGTTFTRRCRAGQVLFGKRRAYQRKVAVADFDAVVSGDIYVFEAKTDRLLPELLPFLCLSEPFSRFAVETSAGSLSPRTNWRHLADFEFPLPPLDQQRRLAELLWAADGAAQTGVATQRALESSLRSTVEAALDDMFDGPCGRLGTLWTESPNSGCSAPPSAAQTGHYVLSLSAISSAGYLPGHLKRVEPTAAMLDARLSRGDFLISRSNTRELVGLVGIFDEDRNDVSFPDTMMRLRVDEGRLLKPFLECVLLSERGRKHMMRSAAGTSGSMKKINRQTLGQCVVPTPTITEQQALVERVRTIRRSIHDCEDTIASTRQLIRAVVDKCAL